MSFHRRATTAQRVRDFIEAGRIGTVPEIAHDLNATAMSVNSALGDMQTRGMVVQVDTKAIRYGGSNGRISSPVWGKPSPEDFGPVVQRALRRRLPLERAWAGVGA